MKNLNFLLLFFFLSTFVVSCSEDEPEPTISIQTSESECVLGAGVNERIIIHFNSSHSWTASTDASSWAVVTPTSGQAGDATLSILTLGENRTGEERSGTLTLQGGGTAKASIRFTQKAMDVLNVEQTSFSVPAQGGEVNIEFETNVAGEVHIVYKGEAVDWITEAEGASTRAMTSGVFTLNVLPNSQRSTRQAQFEVRVVETGNADNVLLQSPTITVAQEAAPVGTSTSFALDKQVTQLMTHSVGNGVPIVIMGDGFIDTDISGGYYREVMLKALEHLFSEEPLHSLQEYFDVWEVAAVSRNNAFGSTYSTALGGQLPTDGTTTISGNHEKVMEYAQAVPEIAADQELYESLLCVVILNDPMYAGTCYFGFGNMDGGTAHFAIGYCPVINGLNDDLFRRTLVHEGIGHGFTKLLDEYSYESMGAIPSSEVTRIRQQQELGWAANVDFTSSTTNVKWARFISDDRYKGADAWGETLSVYQGACTYWSGAYRPTNDSMMRNNQHGFNVPSREAIWKRVMQEAYGPEWTYDYEEFVNFDQAHLPHPADNASTRALPGDLPQLPAPKFVGQPLKYIR